MTNVSLSSHVQSQLASIMELMAKTAISEIIRLFDESYEVLRHEISRNLSEKEALKRKLQEVQEELTCVRMRLGTSLLPSNCPPPREHALQDWTNEGQTVATGVNFEHLLVNEQQSLKEDSFLVHIKEEAPLDELWSQEAEPMRYNTTASVGHPLSQEALGLRSLKLKSEPQEVEVAQLVSAEIKQAQSSTDAQEQPGAPSQEAEEEEEEAAVQAEPDDSERFLPFLPQIEQAFGYFHSNPISPEQPEPPPSPPQPSGPGPSAGVLSALALSLGNHGVGYVSPPMPRKGRGAARRPLVCPVCQKQVPAPSELTKHMRTHTGERPFACSICGMHFSLKSSLKTHERLHSGLRPYRCAHCGKDYTLSHHLKRHMRSHSRERNTATQGQGPEQQQQQLVQGLHSL